MEKEFKDIENEAIADGSNLNRHPEEIAETTEEASEESFDESADPSPEDIREERLDELFRSYPSTLSLLKATPEIEIEESIATFLAGVNGFARGSGTPKEDIDEALRMLFSIIGGYRSGKLELETLETMLKGMSYDRRLAEEIAAAEERGRSAASEKKQRAKEGSDGIPNLGNRTAKNESRKRGIFSLAAAAK